MLFEATATQVVHLMENPLEGKCTDIGDTEFIITFEDKTKWHEFYWLPSDEFADIFSVIKQMVPEIEDVPEVLKTSGDYED